MGGLSCPEQREESTILTTPIVEEHIREVVARTFDLDLSHVEPDASAQSLAAWTSLAHLRLISDLEGEFGLRFTMDEMTTMTSVAGIGAVLSRHGVTA